MKIIFRSQEEKEKIIKRLIDLKICPDKLGLKESCLPFIDENDCKDCWNNAIGRHKKRKKRKKQKKIHSKKPKEKAETVICPFDGLKENCESLNTHKDCDECRKWLEEEME